MIFDFIKMVWTILIPTQNIITSILIENLVLPKRIKIASVHRIVFMRAISFQRSAFSPFAPIARTPVAKVLGNSSPSIRFKRRKDQTPQHSKEQPDNTFWF
jgi:hypothetical protein